MRLCCITGARSDYGLMKWPIRALLADPRFTVTTLVSCNHWDPKQGSTFEEILADGLPIDLRVDCLVLDDAGNIDPIGTMAQSTLRIGQELVSARPDAVMLLGDRLEALAAAQAAFLLNIPIIHLCGGDLTGGAMDDAFRHAISKMAALHFVSTETSRRRLLQLGEEPARIVHSGSPGLDALAHLPDPGAQAVRSRLGVTAGRPYVVVTFHPATREEMPLARQLDILLEALSQIAVTHSLVLTGPNSDPGGSLIRSTLENFVTLTAEAVFHESLGQNGYLLAVRHAEAVLGNSSSGLYEAPSLGTPTVNIGNRQQGRDRAVSVLDAEMATASIVAAFQAALSFDMTGVVNPYGSGAAGSVIAETIAGLEPGWLMRPKQFVDLPE